MNRAVVFENYGAANVLKPSDVQQGQPGPSEVMVKHEAIGVNYYDILHRSGRKKFADAGNITGFEAAGVIENIGEKVNGFKLGQRVVYATSRAGTYTRYNCVDQNNLVSLPDWLDSKLAVACFFKGLVAHTLLFRTYSLRENDTIFIHSVASGVGSIMAKWAKSLGVSVIGTVSSDEKKEVAIKNGCSHVFNRQTDDWVNGIKELTNNRGIHIVYDSVGISTIQNSLLALKKFGFLVLFGESSGQADSIDMSMSREKSLFISTPAMFDYKENRMELIMTAEEIFSKIKEGIFADQIAASFSLEAAGKAHELLESGRSINSVILV